MIPVFKPALEIEPILDEIRDSLESGWIGLGPKVEEFERAVSSEIGGLPVVATNSCTSALHLALRNISFFESKWPDSDYVLTTPISFVSTSSIILYENLKPVFVDVEPRTGNIDAIHLWSAISKYKPRALIVVHLGGYPSDMDLINEICSDFGVPVIEDCAHAMGSVYKYKSIGQSSNICCWSFHAVKNLPVGDGGAISCPSIELANRLKRLRWMGIDKDTITRSHNKKYQSDYNVEELGFKYHMSDLHAAVGLIQHRYLEAHNTIRRHLADQYLQHLPPKYHPLYEDDRHSSYHFIPFFFDNPQRIVSVLREAGVFPGHHYDRNDMYGLFREFPKFPDSLEGAEYFSKHEVTLPMHCHILGRDQEKIIDLVLNAEN